MKKELYHQDWQDIIRPLTLKRDNYSCRICGIKHKSRVYKLSKGGYKVLDEFTEAWAISNGKKVYTLYLVVAHLDQNKENNDMSNLMTMCPFHHAKYDAKSKSLIRNIKFNPHDAKFRAITPDPLQIHIDHLREIKSLIRDITALSIDTHEAEAIFNLTLNFLQNGKN